MSPIRKSDLKNHLSRKSLQKRFATDPIVQGNTAEPPVSPIAPPKASPGATPLEPATSALRSVLVN